MSNDDIPGRDSVPDVSLLARAVGSNQQRWLGSGAQPIYICAFAFRSPCPLVYCMVTQNFSPLGNNYPAGAQVLVAALIFSWLSAVCGCMWPTHPETLSKAQTPVS